MVPPYCIRDPGPAIMSEPKSVVDLVRYWNRASVASLTSVDHAPVVALLESGKAMLQSLFTDLWSEVGDLPVLVSYSSDATPLRHVGCGLPASSTLTATKDRKGRMTMEVLVEHVFVRWFDGLGEPHSRVQMREPRPLTWGKSGNALFACAQETVPLPRANGHSGVAISHYLFDGGIRKFLVKRMKQQHFLSARARSEDWKNKGYSPHDLYLTEWIIHSQCAAHVCHNALKWAMGESTAAVSLLEELWQVFASLRNSTDLLRGSLSQWVVEHVEYVPAYTLPTAEESRPVWSAVGLGDDWKNKVAMEWRLLWTHAEEKFLVSDEFQDDPEFVQELIDLISSHLAIHKYTASRWLTVGKSCRQLALCIMLGIESFVKDILATHKGDTHLRGFSKLAEQGLKQFSIVCGLVAYVPDAVLDLILIDPRGGLHADKWQHASIEYVEWLMMWESGWWQALSQRTMGANENWRVLQDAVMEAAFVAMAFMQQECFAVAQDYPWKLGQGDILQNLLALGEEDDVGEATTWKIQQLVRQGWNMEELIRGVRLMMEASWATTLTEQQHASVTLFKKHHPDMWLEGILARAGLHALRRLLPEERRHDKLVKKLADKVEKLNNQGGSSKAVSGRMMFFKELAEKVKERAFRESKRASLSSYQSVLKAVSLRWPLLPPGRQQVYEEMAEDYMALKEVNNARAQEEAMQQLREARTKKTARDRESAQQAMTLDSCKLSPQAIQRWQNILDANPPRSKRVTQLWDRALRTPQPPDDLTIQRLEDTPWKDGTLPAQKQAWLSPLCHMRTELAPCGLRFLDGQGGVLLVVKVLYCKMSPLELHGLVLEYDEEGTDLDYGLPSPAAENWKDDWCHTYKHDMQVLTGTHLPFVPIDLVEVVRPMVFRHGCHVVCDDLWTPLPRIMGSREFKEPKENTDDHDPTIKKVKKLDDDEKQLLKEYPGLTASSLGAQGSTYAGGSASKDIDYEDSSDSATDHEAQAYELEQAFDDLEQDRAVEVDRTPVRLKQFQAKIRFNNDCWQGQTVRSHAGAMMFVRAAGLQQTKKFNVRLGEQEPAILAFEWANRMQYYYDCNEEGLLRDPDTRQQCIDAYEETAAFVEVAANAVGDVLHEVELLRAMAPFQ